MQIVAPAGSLSALRAAVNAGADAVYVGMPRFGARAKARNFDTDELKSAVEYAHLFGTKIFVTLNTLIKDREMRDALYSAKHAYDLGVDAAIVQDIRFIEKLKSLLPDFPLHASTQMGIHNADGAKVMKDLGIRRAVLSRETLPQDIADIKKTGIETEFFVQGALCVCFSGNCYFSSLASSYSGNRGKCMQLCRKKYRFRDGTGYYLSAKDICLYDRLGELDALGVDAVKIEGRMRSDEYVAQSVRVYKSHINSEDAKNALKAVYNRGDYCSAYLDESAPFDVIYSKLQGNMGVCVGKIDRINKKEIYVRNLTPHQNDGFKILRGGAEVGGASVNNGKISADCVCKTGDEIRRTFDGALSEELKTAERKIPINVSVKITEGALPTVCVSRENVRIDTTGAIVSEHAATRAVTSDDIVKNFEKVADFPFVPNIKVDIAGEPFMPVSALNELRRNAYTKFKKATIDLNSPIRYRVEHGGLHFNKFDGRGTIVMVENDIQLQPRLLSEIDYIAVNPRDYSSIRYPKTDKPILLNLPITMRGADKDIIIKAIDDDRVYGVISNNPYALAVTEKPILLGVGNNIIGECAFPHIRSFEADEIRGDNVYAYMFGYAPIMTLCHCPYGKCVNCNGDDCLIDEHNRKFALRRYKLAHCYWQLLNYVPHNLTADTKHVYKNRFYDCTGLSSDEISKVLSGEYCGEYTRGNINKGLK